MQMMVELQGKSGMGIVLQCLQAFDGTMAFALNYDIV
jgi:hypothetical protein